MNIDLAKLYTHIASLKFTTSTGDVYIGNGVSAEQRGIPIAIFKHHTLGVQLIGRDEYHDGMAKSASYSECEAIFLSTFTKLIANNPDVLIKLAESIANKSFTRGVDHCKFQMRDFLGINL